MSAVMDLTKFEALYKENFAFLSLVSFQITKDKEVSKDIVQEFFIYFWNKKEEINITTSFKSYGSRAVKNLSIQHLEKSKQIVSIEKNKLVPDSEEPVFFEKMEEGKISKVMKLLNQLPEARRNIFLAHVVDNNSYSEIAENENISINTVKTQMKRSYSFLREKMDTCILILTITLFR
ncbi:RNA polymerase sigma-70 factor, ECF subfamily [Flavobacterium fluvii]|uniref:RNA polymerase sigma-70 factor, ECF subfamily n=2 Tax=Flavobacterium fluvii TaxID=468056 RepID=A0A1M5NII6_9FLAO|nr:RNA polymerase sigma-70 factor, ECF subfamily [Flavobacterium fluvii]